MQDNWLDRNIDQIVCSRFACRRCERVNPKGLLEKVQAQLGLSELLFTLYCTLIRTKKVIDLKTSRGHARREARVRRRGCGRDRVGLGLECCGGLKLEGVRWRDRAGW